MLEAGFVPKTEKFNVALATAAARATGRRVLVCVGILKCGLSRIRAAHLDALNAKQRQQPRHTTAKLALSHESFFHLHPCSAHAG